MTRQKLISPRWDWGRLGSKITELAKNPRIYKFVFLGLFFAVLNAVLLELFTRAGNGTTLISGIVSALASVLRKASAVEYSVSIGTAANILAVLIIYIVQYFIHDFVTWKERYTADKKLWRYTRYGLWKVVIYTTHQTVFAGFLIVIESLLPAASDLITSELAEILTAYPHQVAHVFTGGVMMPITYIIYNTRIYV